MRSTRTAVPAKGSCPLFQRPAVLRHGIGQGPADHQLLRRKALESPRTTGIVPAGLPCHPARSSKGHHPPRYQAVECAGRRVRRSAGGQGDRLWRGQGRASTADRTDDVHRPGADHRDAGVHESRTSPGQPIGHRHPQRRLFAGRVTVRAADRQHAVRSPADAGGGAGRVVADHS